jgi:anhydro-N-acetylmuramic acid kinase
MLTQQYSVLGVMSGTSLDGVDLAHIHFTIENNNWLFQIGVCETIPYTDLWHDRLKKAVDFSTEALEKLNLKYTILLSEVILDFINKHSLENLDAVCSHGHTILHQPQNGFTLQIGNLPFIAKLTRQNVVCDFRVKDVQLGGQGAPLVPIGDEILFSNYDYCLNLGGFSNISFNDGNRRIAFDISAVNTILNYYANLLGLPYDNKGKIARSGKINKELLNQLNELDFYKRKYPKSLGIEYVKTVLLPILEHYTISIQDKLATFTAHIAIQIALVLPKKEGSLLITGGGAYNDYLIEKINEFIPKVKVIIPDSKTIEFKEALIFGLLGVLKLRNEINVLSSVTGSAHDHSSGFIFKYNEVV